MAKPKIYISGRITGIELHAEQLFDKAEKMLVDMGYDVVNPMKLPHEHDQEWKDFMKEDIKHLMQCDIIYMLPNYSDSRGARIELFLAGELSMTVYFEGRDFVPIVSAD